MHCPDCAAEVPDDDLFCENCGRRLSTAAATEHAAATAETQGCGCGADPGEVDEDGFCTRCGRRVRRPASDHVEQALSPLFAAVCDRGLRHDRNEDRCGIFQSPHGYAMVVCDGVSATRKSEMASAAVSEGTLKFLKQALESNAIGDPETVMRQAIAAGEANLRASMTRDGGENPPSTTLVAALVAEGHATLGWVGDSRAYWVDATGAHALTRDHSWLNLVMANTLGAAGALTREEAEKAPQAHTITRWIGADAGENSAPEILQYALNGSGTLLLCTDGLWNYAPGSEAMAKILQEASAGDTDALSMARRLVEFANSCGGQDNITVAVLRHDSAELHSESTEPQSGTTEPAAEEQRLTGD